MSNPKISVVIPVYEPTEFFSAALESLTIQTFKDFEVVVSDDTPTSEKAIAIINHCPDLRIKYIQNKTGRGIFNNLNNAIKHSNGNFIQIFCQDDIMLPHFLEKQVELFEKFPTVGLGFSRYLDIDSEGIIMPFLPHMEAAAITWERLIVKERAINYLFVFGCFPGNLSPVMLKREVFEKVGYFEEAYSFGGDYEFWIRTAGHFNFAYNKEISLHVRTHEDQASETLGLFKLVPDAAALYKSLYYKTSVRATKIKKYLQVNNLVAGYFKGITKNLLKGRLQYFKLYKYLHSYPIHIPAILLIILHRKIKGKVTWFISEKDC